MGQPGTKIFKSNIYSQNKMTILFHCTFENSKEWKIKIKKKFKTKKIISIYDKNEFDKVDIAIIWNLPNQILNKLTNLKIIFSLGAGVDHILKLNDYNGTPIIRIKDPSMGELMYYYVLSQILNFQVGINDYKIVQKKKVWGKAILPSFNKDLTIGIIFFPPSNLTASHLVFFMTNLAFFNASFEFR